MEFYNTEEMLKHKRYMQQVMKKQGHQLKYKKSKDTFELIANDSNKKIIIAWDSFRKSIINIEQTAKPFTQTELEAITLFIKLLTPFALELGAVNHKVFFMQRNEIPMLEEYMESIDMLPVSTVRNLYVTRANYSFLEPLETLYTELKKHYDELRYKYNLIQQLSTQTNNLPEKFLMKITELIERSLLIKADMKTRQYYIQLSSPYHRKEIHTTEISMERIEEEMEQFKIEEKLQRLFVEPVMNEKIQSHLEGIFQPLSHAHKPIDLFKYLIKQGFTLEKLDELSIYTWDSKLIKSLHLRTRENEVEDSSRSKTYTTHNVNVVKCMGKFLVAAYVNGTGDETDGVTDFFLYDDAQSAINKANSWMIEGLSK